MSVQEFEPLDAPLYSLAHLTLIGCTPAELVYVASRAGYDAVSPRFITMNVPGEVCPLAFGQGAGSSHQDGTCHYRA